MTIEIPDWLCAGEFWAGFFCGSGLFGIIIVALLICGLKNFRIF